MLNAIAHGRIGRDTELRFIPSGEAVADLAIACNFGRKGEDGNYPTQWVKATLWGKQAEALAPYLTKGKGVVVIMQDVHIEEYEGKNGKGSSLVGRVSNIEFAISSPRDESAPAPAPRAQAPRQAPAPAPRGHGSAARAIHGDDFDGEEIPF